MGVVKAGITEAVFDNTNDSVSVIFSDENGPIDMSNASRVTISLTGLALLDTADNSDLVDFSGDVEGELIFKIGGEAIAHGVYNSVVLVYDADHPQGQTLANPCGAILDFKFCPSELS